MSVTAGSHRAIAAGGHAVHRVLVEARVGLGVQADDGATLGPDQIDHRDPDGPAEVRGDAEPQRAEKIARR